MKYLGCFLTYLVVSNALFSEEKHYLVKQDPSFEELRFVYQKNVLEQIFPWDAEKYAYIETPESEALKQKISLLNTTAPIPEQENYLYPISSLAIAFLCKTFFHTDFQSISARYYLLNYVAFKNIQGNQSLPESLIPVDKEILKDSQNKSYYQIFLEKIASLYLRPLNCLETNSCVMSIKDKLSIKRICNDKSNDKTILFVGFSQSCPTEGSKITFNTPGYRKSLFWSKCEEQPDQNHNAIKFCFCQTKNFLLQCPKFENFFDYIIIGGQTIEYIPTKTWIHLGKMLKKNGRIVYPHLGYFVWGPFINKLLNSTSSQSFSLYMCNNHLDPIFQEIQELTSFNTQASPGEFCYKHALKLYWHKKN